MREPPFPLRLAQVNRLTSPAEAALGDLRRRGNALTAMCAIVKAKGFSMALQWLDQELYCFESSKQRWPDGRYYLLNRSYELWRGHRISFTHEKLIDIPGMLQWQNKRFHPAITGNTYQLQSDSFRPAPATMREFAALICEVARAWELHNDR